MTGDGDLPREKTREFFQLLGAPEADDAGSVLTGWVVVQEWMNPDGCKFLVRAWDEALPLWTVKGIMHEVLFGDWPADEEEE